MKLAHRLSIIQSILVAVALLACTAAVLLGARWYFTSEIRLSQARALDSLALVARESVLKADDLLVVNYLKNLMQDPSFAHAEFVNEKRGLRLASGPEAPLPAEVTAYEAEVTFPGRTEGRVRISFWKREVDRKVRDSLLQFLPVLGLAFVLSLTVGVAAALLLARQLARPILELQARTESVKRGQWEHLLEVRGDDELAELSRKFNDMMVQLKELEAMKRDFTASVTHELLSPLNAIHSGVNYLSAGSAGPLTPEQVDYLLILSNSAGQLAEFITNLLQVSKIEAGKMEVFFEPTDVSSELASAVKLFTPQAIAKGLVLEVADGMKGASWVLDRVMFRQVINNILSNAIKFTAKGGVTVRLAPEDGKLVMEISDTGIGIDDQHHRLIFEKFYRVLQPSDSPNRKGTGLGLAIVRGILEIHGGEVTVESAKGKGATFRASFPRREPSR